MSNQNQRPNLTTEEIEIRIWAIVVLSVIVIFAGITIAMLYSIIFVVQPIKAMAPIDQAFVKMLNDIVLLIVGGIGGIMGNKGIKAASNAINTLSTPPSGATSSAPATAVTSAIPGAAFGAMPVFINPEFDESWRPGPPPTIPEDHLHPEREEIANEREAAKAEL